MSFHPVLQKILDEKKREIPLIQIPSHSELPIYSLRKFLEEKKVPILAECKKASPSAGTIRESYDPVQIAKIYEKSGAGGISVLTDRKFFSGKEEDLYNVSKSVSIPVLRKDFILSKEQILEARSLGASAVLLIVRILSPETLEELHKFSRSLGMEVLVETHTEEEVGIALEIGAEIIGINTRDLDTFKILPHVIPTLSRLVPDTVHCIGESGIHSGEELKQVLGHVDSALIGTYFMKMQDIERAYRELLAPFQ